MSILSLSVELLQEIGRQITKADHKSLRAVCRYLALGFDPLFFSSLVLWTQQLKRDEDGAIYLETLATGKTGWSRFATTLSIDPNHQSILLTGGEDIPSISQLQHLLGATLGSMPNIQTVKWYLRPEYHDWPRNAIAAFLNSHPLLDNLQLDVQGLRALDFSLDQISGLRKFKFGGLPYSGPSELVQPLTQVIINNRQLSSLDLQRSDNWSYVWTALRMAQVHLTDVATNSVTEELLTYLASYSGIQRLDLGYPDAGSEAESDRLADIFFDTVLPRHASSLVQLSCPAGYESRWSFGSHNADVISCLPRISKLVMSVNCVDVPSYSEENSVERLLQVAAQLPRLRHVRIYSAECEEAREAECGNPSMVHDEEVDQGIALVMEDFRPCSLSPAVVVVACSTETTYELRASSRSDAEFVYCVTERR
ncbi:hypothetical protein DFH09DRAFT_1183025 [Mycena vulgaris]|nr:hypothetical protein DFH09DRAFT_1183025 [Mycena vulgaris]